MSNHTTNLNLYEIDKANDTFSTFDIDTVLNENWQKIDEKVINKNGTVAFSAEQIGVDPTSVQGLATKNYVDANLALKADLNGSSAEVFEVADATQDTEAINKGQLDTAISAVNSDIEDLEDEVDTKASQTYVDTQLATKLDVSDTTVTKQGNTFNGASQLVQMNSSAQLPVLDGSLLTGVVHAIAANTTIYVATTGSDTTGDGTSSAPYATIQKALDSLNGEILLGALTIQVADGTYSSSTSIIIDHPQSKLISIIGNTTTPENCVLYYTGSNAFIILANYNCCTINGFRVLGTLNSSTQGICLVFHSLLYLSSSMIIEGFGYNISIDSLSELVCYSGIVLKYAVNAALRCQNNSYAYCPNTSIIGNSSSKTTYGLYSGANALINATSSTINNCVTGSYARTCSCIVDTSISYTNCTTNRSPASNTIGNENSYITT
jgi:hypothetical protein